MRLQWLRSTAAQDMWTSPPCSRSMVMRVPLTFWVAIGGRAALVSLADDLNQVGVPAEWQARSTWDGDRGELVTGPLSEPLTDFSDLLERFGYDPNLVEIVGKVNQWRKQTPKGEWLTSYFFGIQSKRNNVDLPALYQEARRKHRPRTVKQTARTVVPVIADVQVGKTASRGGTPELIDRLAVKRDLLKDLLSKRKPDSIFLPDVGDLIENFNSGGNPMFTNDLSLTQQLDVAATEIFLFVELCARFAPVTVATVPSNHGAWRQGKQQLGKPSDDFGVFVHQQVRKHADAAGLPATWSFPPAHDEAHVVQVRDTRVGLVHGNQYAPGGAVKWWEGQQHGGQPVGSADILLAGHYHHLNVLPSGRNPYTGRSKWFLQAPTLDNGSDWFRNVAGDDSSPGLLVFDITDDGFDLSSLTVL